MKTIDKLLAEITKKTVEQVNDSEPFYLHQGEVMEAMKKAGKEAIKEYSRKLRQYNLIENPSLLATKIEIEVQLKLK